MASAVHIQDTPKLVKLSPGKRKAAKSSVSEIEAPTGSRIVITV
ncbi:hypothetical protein CHCC15337_2056 [Bacillus paralicheniformis]|nr:hypothetical protein CHCC5021_0651 [Bacillus paralicheniformis]TWL04075.1 hypothetical protein CHCC19468_0933 [Bacillus paralicheniformis]TWL09974.1 hypothetical protein CHCC19467_2246 [Bacillus paralicheniformis]TWL46465.1 hypothetical protein CHCC15337_2056 [Bacillus paralicheniformis]TWL47621.1 hypothetical protein CHCC15332_1807 [Bacillus paralicheniformis]